MRNSIVGIIVVGIALLIGFIIFSFNRALKVIVSTACSHGSECPMWGTINFQTNVSLGIMALVVCIGVYLIISSKDKRFLSEPLRLDGSKRKNVPVGLGADEKAVYDRLVEADGMLFQSDIVDKTGMTKVKVTRILDRLEGRKIVERHRRGMTNVVILK